MNLRKLITNHNPALVSLTSFHPLLPSLFMFIFLIVFLYANNVLADRIVSSPVNESVVPKREIKQKVYVSTEWKHLWDEARQLVRSGDYERAAKKYEELILQKEDLEEARWEFARVLLQLHQQDKAIVVLERLLEISPDRFEYLNSLAIIMHEKDQTDRSVDLFIKAHEQKPDDLTVLKAIVHGLFSLGKKKEVLPFLEKLYQKLPEDRKVRWDLVQLYYDLGRYDEARPHVADLAQSKKAAPEIVLMAALVHEKLGLDNLAADYWKRILAKKPNNPEALDKIAKLYENSGQGEKALEYLLLLLSIEPDEPTLLKRIGRIYMGQTRFSDALPYFEKYIAHRSDDKEALRLVADIYIALGNEAKTLDVLERFFALEANPDPVNLKQAAELYDVGGRHQEAIALYKRLMSITPNDFEVLAKLAKNLFIVGEEESALSLWEQLDRNQKLLEVLEMLYSQEPFDDRVALKLATMYLNRGDLVKSDNIFKKMGQRGYKKPAFWEYRGLLFEKRDMPEQALRDYEKLLHLSPERDDIRLRCVRLSGELGKLSLVNQYFAAVNGNSAVAENVEVRLMIASAFRECGAYELALQEYQNILSASFQPANDLKFRALLGLAKVHKDAGMFYEAEEALRIALNFDPDSRVVLSLLFELSLISGRTDDAEIWLGRLEDFDGAVSSWQTDLKRAQLLSAKGAYRAAIKLGYRILADISKQKELVSQEGGERDAVFEVNRDLVRFLLEAGRLKQAKRQCKKLVDEGKAELEPLVLLTRAYSLGGELQEAKEIFTTALDIAKYDLGTLLRLIVLCRNYGLTEEMLEVASVASQSAPDSLKIKFLLSEALSANGKNKQTVELLDSIVSEYPENIEAPVMRAKMLFKMGQFDKSLAQCEKVLKQKPKRPDVYLLEARILWAQNQKDEAQKKYSDFLAPSVEELFVEKNKQKGLTLPFRKKRSLWSTITFAEDDQLNSYIDMIMEPVYVVEHSGQGEGFTDIAASLYALYRWQRQFAVEQEARRFMQRMEYFQAASKYEALLEEYPEEESVLFDLAGIYSRLGKLGKEAGVYEKLKSMNTQYPGLVEVEQRNRLKRQPRISAGYGFQKEEGRDGYKNIRKEKGEMALWYSPHLQHEFDVSVSRINYQTAEGDKKIKSTRAFFEYETDMSDRLSLSLGGGVEALDNGHPDTALFNCALFGKFGDRLNSNIAFTRDLVADTPASLTRHVVQQDITTAVSMNLFSRILLGGEYEFTDYSDGNETSGYELSAAYILFRDPTFLKFSYTYDFKDSQEGASAGIASNDGFATNDHPYWAPVNYWTNRFSLFFRHQLSDNILGRGIPRYYSAEYTVEYDANGHAIQTWGGGFYVELTPSIIAEATAEVTSSQVYRNKEFFLSLVYRW